MKQSIKIISGIMVIAIIALCTLFFVNGCTKSSNNKDESMVVKENHLKSAKPHHVVIRWSGVQGQNCVCPNCKCPGCPCPLGVCMCGGIPPGTVPTLQDYQDGYRNLNAEIIDGKLHLIFQCDVALPNGTIVISSDYTFTQDELDSFSLNQPVQMLAGIYNVDFSNYTYGEVFIDLEYL